MASSSKPKSSKRLFSWIQQMLQALIVLSPTLRGDFFFPTNAWLLTFLKQAFNAGDKKRIAQFMSKDWMAFDKRGTDVGCLRRDGLVSSQ